MKQSKKFVSLILAIAMIMSCFACLSSISASAAENNGRLLGDVDNSGVVDVMDATWIQLYIAQDESMVAAFDDETKWAANMDGGLNEDGTPSIDITDATLIQMLIAHVEPATPDETTVPDETTPDETEPETTEPEEEDAVYSIAGSSAALFGGAWDKDNTATEMTKNDDGTYSITFANAQPEQNVGFKVLQDHNWDNSWGNPDGSNFVFNIDKVCDVTITFDPATETITVTADPEDAISFHTFNVDVMRAVGEGTGSAFLNGTSWDPASDLNIMEEIAEGIYEIAYEGVDSYDGYQVKFAANGDWTDNFGLGDDPVVLGQPVNAKYNGDNIIFEVEEDDSTVKLQLDLRNFDFATKEGATFTITVIPPEEEEPTTPATPDETQPTEPETTEPEATEPETTEPEEEDAVYSIAGSSAALFGAGWDKDNTATEMTKNDDGTYFITFANAQPEQNVGFKVLQDHNWDTSWGDNGENYVFNINKVCDVTITFDPATETITVTADPEDAISFHTFNVDVMRAVGEGTGSAFLNGTSWDPASDLNIMEEIAEGIYEIAYEGVDSYDGYQVKFAANGDWTDNFGLGDDPVVLGQPVNAKYNGDNIIFEVEEDDSTVKLQLDLRNFNPDTLLGATFTITVIPPEEEEPTTPSTPDETQPTEPETTEPETTEPEEEETVAFTIVVKLGWVSDNAGFAKFFAYNNKTDEILEMTYDYSEKTYTVEMPVSWTDLSIYRTTPQTTTDNFDKSPWDESAQTGQVYNKWENIGDRGDNTYYILKSEDISENEFSTEAPEEASNLLKTIYFDNSKVKWSEVYIYGWANGFNNNFVLMDQIPGTDIWYYTFADGNEREYGYDASVLFVNKNSWNNQTQTQNIKLPEDTSKNMVVPNSGTGTVGYSWSTYEG